MTKKIFKNEPNEDTGYEYVSAEGRTYWGIDKEGKYKCFTKKYHSIIEVEEKKDDKGTKNSGAIFPDGFFL